MIVNRITFWGTQKYMIRVLEHVNPRMKEPVRFLKIYSSSQGQGTHYLVEHSQFPADVKFKPQNIIFKQVGTRYVIDSVFECSLVMNEHDNIPSWNAAMEQAVIARNEQLRLIKHAGEFLNEAGREVKFMELLTDPDNGMAKAFVWAYQQKEFSTFDWNKRFPPSDVNPSSDKTSSDVKVSS
jgi:hypothetical protein